MQQYRSYFLVWRSLVLMSGFLLYTSAAVWAQLDLSAFVKEAQTQEPIPYANIGIPKKAIGTVSDEQGAFQLEGAASGDLVVISAIGYASRSILASELKNGGVIELTSKTYDLKAVEVFDVDPAELEVFGYRLDKKKASIKYGSAQLGAEIGARIKIKKRSWIRSAHFTLNHAKGDSMHFRLNLYKMEGDEVGENLLQENVIIHLPQRTGTIEIDLRPFNVILEKEVLMSLEWIRNDGENGNEGISFRGRLFGKDNAYTRLTSQAAYIPVEELAPGAPGLQMGFYLMGKKLD